MAKIKKALARVGIAIVVLAIILGAGGGFYFKIYLPNTVAPKSFPQIEGEIKLVGLNGAVDVYRDAMGIPHIYAGDLHDLFFAQGFLHAQDRFWQMDVWRHIGSGRLSEMFGQGQVETDSFLRTLGWRETAEKEWLAMGPESIAILQAYTDGVNAYLKDHTRETVSLEYAILGLLSPDYKITAWEPVNSLTWGKAMAWDLRGNLGDEIERAVLLKTLTPGQVAELFPPYPADHPVIVNQIGNGSSARAPVQPPAVDLSDQALAALDHNASLLDLMLGHLGDGIGSNSWAVAGTLTASGTPLLANDMHLSIQMPSIWYQNSLHCKPKSSACPYEVTGFSFAGVPGIVAGHNDRIAWGYTNVGPDVMDLFIEKVNPENPQQYESHGQWVDFEFRTETIGVVGGDPVEITVRLTRHGPVISDTYGPLKDAGDPKDKEFVAFKDRAGIDLPGPYVMALSWTALNPSTPFEAIWGFNKAENWDQFRAAARKFHVPAQNLLYADTDGNIGYQMPGDIPIRKKGDGSLPVPGWTGDYDWAGFIPFDELPYTFNPSEGYIATANNRVPPRDYPYNVTADWDYGFRAERIVDLIKNAPGKIDIAYIQKMQGDMFDANAPVFVPLIQAAVSEPGDPLQAAALERVSQWDFQARADSGGAAVFEAFWRHLLQNTFNDDLPERYRPDGGSRWNEVMRNLKEDSGWWDDRATQNVIETRADILKKSFGDGVKELEGLSGKDPAKWNWGDMHAATFRNGTLGESGIGLIEDLFNRGPYPVGGGDAIVDATGWSVIEGYETDWLPSEREIVDLGNLANSVAVHTTGESGHAYNKHYADMIPLWATIKYFPMLWDEPAVVSQAEGHLILTP